MARRRTCAQSKRVGRFLMVSVAVLFFGLSLLVFLSSARVFSSGRGRSPLPSDPVPSTIPSSRAVIRSTMRFFKSMAMVEMVSTSNTDAGAEILLRLRGDARKVDFLSGLQRFLNTRNAALLSSRLDRKRAYPIRLVVDMDGRPLVIRAGWNRTDATVRRPVPARKRPQTGLAPGGKRSPRVAIVLDDAGDRNPYQWLFLGLDYKLTFAVMPDLDNSRSFARRAVEGGFQIILHAPMEPYDFRSMGRPARFLSSSLNTPQVIRMLAGFFASVPGVIGMNNHMGSKATADPLLMRVVMRHLKKKKLFFIDSWTHASSKAYDTAVDVGVPVLKRDLFLDNKRDRQYIKDRLYKLARIAVKRGHALGIGHVTHPEMFYALKEMLPRLRQIGIQFVFASELLK